MQILELPWNLDSVIDDWRWFRSCGFAFEAWNVFAEYFDCTVIVGMQLRSEEVIAWIAGNLDDGIFWQVGILALRMMGTLAGR